ncbi:unnamed protein product [Calypogeia fissa]
MVLEATVICIDNSEWMRNGDYAPTRFQAQADAVNLICGAKTQSNPENTVGVLTMAGKGVRVLVTPTPDLGKILSCMHGLEIGGEMDLQSGVQVAQLALKHRQNKHQRQRIVLFAGSPIDADKKVLETIGKKLKKTNVALDIVSFGEEDDGKSEKLDALLNAVISNENSHIVHVPPQTILSDVLISSSIFTGDGEGGSGFAAAAAAGAAAAAAAAAGGAGGFEFGVDPNLDPELALALRVSMEEERARQEAAARRAADESTKSVPEAGEGSTQNADVAMTDAIPAPPAVHVTEKEGDLMDEETALLEQALAMSMVDDADAGASGGGDIPMADSMSEELALALQMSMAEAAEAEAAATAAAVSATSSQAAVDSEMSRVLGDQSFVHSVLASLPGVDPNDPSVRELVASFQQEEEQGKEDSKSKDTEG